MHEDKQPELVPIGEPSKKRETKRKAHGLGGAASSKRADWYTPPNYVDPARTVFDGFDLDPASDEHANRIVRAKRYYTNADDGLVQPWYAGVVWCNPPSAKGESAAWQWWLNAVVEWRARRCYRVFFMVFNPSAFFQIAQAKANEFGLPTPQQAARVEFRDRISYWRLAPTIAMSGADLAASFEPGESPPHGSALMLFGATGHEEARFFEAYKELGDGILPAMRPSR